MGVLRIEIDIQRLRRLDGPDLAAALSELQAIRRTVETNPLVAYNPWSKQWQTHVAAQKVRLFLGGNRAGKTTMGICDDIVQVTPRELVPAELHGLKRYDCPCHVRICNPSSKLQRSVIVPKIKEWIPKALLRQGSWEKSYSTLDQMLMLECGCTIELLSYEQELNKFGGTARHRVHYDEEPPEDIRDECFARTIDFDGDELFTMTPTEGLTWTYEDLVLRGHEDPDYIYVTVASMLDNPFLAPSARERTLKLWGTGKKANSRIHGQFVHMAGMVYPSWRICERERDFHAEELNHMDVYVGIDPGARWTGLVWVGFDPDTNEMHVFDAEKIEDVEGVDEVKRKIDEVNEKWRIKDPQYVIDPAAEARQVGSGKKVIVEYHNQGLYPLRGDNDRQGGVMNIRRRINNALIHVYADAYPLKREAITYRILEREDGIFDVIKEHDHCLDALRYVAMERPYDPAPPRPKHADLYGPGIAAPPPKKIEVVSSMGRFA